MRHSRFLAAFAWLAWFGLAVATPALAATDYTWYRDADGDGYGDPSNSITTTDSTAPSGYVANNTDCWGDNNATVHPGGSEAGTHASDALDNNCNGYVDEGPGDMDNDGVDNLADNCPFASNPGQENLDGDGLGDVCDPDKDQDNVSNAVDNCPSLFNPGQEDTDNDGAGDVCDPTPNGEPGSLSGRYFIDTNKNGVDDDGPGNGVSGVDVELLDASDNPTGATTSTAADGSYSFDGLVAGAYGVKFTDTVSGLVLITSNVGADDTVDSDAADLGGGVSQITGIVVIAVTDTPDNDAGVADPGTGAIGDTVWFDANGNGTRDGAEAGIANVGVSLLDGGGEVITSTTTDPNGAYLFENLDAGDYKVKVDLPTGFEFTTQDSGDDTTDSDVDSAGVTGAISLAVAETNLTVDAGVADPGTGAIGDTVWFDANGNGTQDGAEAGIANVGVSLLDGGGEVITSTTTDPNGAYLFENLDAGDYKVKVELPTGYEFTTQDSGDDTADSDVDSTGVTATISLAVAEANLTVDAGVADPGTGSIGDTVWFDANGNGTRDGTEAGIANVGVSLLDGGGEVIASTTTDPNGAYLFENLDAGDYKVKVELPTGFEFTTQDSGDDTTDSDVDSTGVTATISLAVAETNLTVDAGVADPGTGSIGDTVWFDANGNGTRDGGEAGIGNVGVSLLDGGGEVITSTTTDPNGDYLFDNLDAGDYKVKVDLPTGFEFTTQDSGDDTTDSDVDSTGVTGAISLAVAETNLTVDAGLADPGTGSIGDTIWFDANGNGTRDGGEAGIGNVGVSLLDGGGEVITSTTTDPNGAYLFENLDAGDYKVKVDLPTGFEFTTQDSGDDTTDSDVDSTGVTGTISLAVAETNLTVDAGLREAAPTETDLSIVKTASTDLTGPGGTITYTIIASNDGSVGDADVTGAQVSDTPPGQCQAGSWTAATAGGASATASGNWPISETVGLPVGGSVTYTAICELGASATGTVSNTATIAAPSGITDTNLANNTDTANTQIDSIAPTVSIDGAPARMADLSPFVVTIRFSEDVNGFHDTDVTVGNGTVTAFTPASASEYTVEITPSAPGEVTIDVFAGVAQDDVGNDNDAATQVVVLFDSVPATTGLIGAMQEQRAKLILEHGPDLRRRLNRLKGVYSNNGGVSGFGLAYNNDNLPVAMTLGNGSASFAYSLRNSRAKGGKQGLSGDVGRVATSILGAPETRGPTSTGDYLATNSQALAYSGSLSASEKQALGVKSDIAPLAMFDAGATAETASDPMAQRFDVWAEGQYTRFNATAGDGTFAILNAGSDYLVTKDLLVGLGAQFDWIDMNAASGPGTADGWGFMVGPYMTAKLAPGLYLDARGAWGQSYNHVSPFGTYTDLFDGTRWLATAALIGDFKAGNLTISPEARLSYFRERSDAYVDSLNVSIPSVTTETGTLEFGPTISQTFTMDDGMRFTPFTTVTGIWTFDQKNTATAVSNQPGLAEEGIRARIEAGFDVTTDNGLSVSISGHYDGIGDDGYEAYGGKAKIGKSF